MIASVFHIIILALFAEQYYCITAFGEKQRTEEDMNVKLSPGIFVIDRKGQKEYMLKGVLIHVSYE